MFIPIWGRFPFWLIFFRWVETNNQLSTDFPFGHLKHQQYESPWSLVHFRSFKKHGGRGEHSNSLRGDLAIPTWTVHSRFLGSQPHIASVACYLLLKRGQIRLKFRSLINTKFEELTLLIPIWIEMSVSPGWDPKPKIATHVWHIYVDLKNWIRMNQLHFSPEKLLSKISNCVQFGNDLRFGIPFITGKRNDFSMETLKEKGFLWLPFAWIWCQSKLGVSNSFFSLGTTPLWLRILFVVVLVSTCCAPKKKTRSFWWRWKMFPAGTAAGWDAGFVGGAGRLHQFRVWQFPSSKVVPLIRLSRVS